MTARDPLDLVQVSRDLVAGLELLGALEAIALPGDASAHGAILVIGFSKDAADVTRKWMECCLAAMRHPGNEKVACYDVRMVEEVPYLFRGMMEKGMKKGYPLASAPRSWSTPTTTLGARGSASGTPPLPTSSATTPQGGRGRECE